MTSLRSALGALMAVLEWLVVLSAAGLVTTMTLQVILRYVLRSSFLGVEEICTLFGLWLYFSGIALISARDRHIRGGFLLSLMPQHVQAVLLRLFAVACALICAWFFLISVDYLQFMGETGRRSTFLRLPSGLWVASLSMGLLLSAVAFAIRSLTRKAAAG